MNKKIDDKIRCAWVDPGSELYKTYHDTEWGVPVRDDRILFEFLLLEDAQAGLSWINNPKTTRELSQGVR